MQALIPALSFALSRADVFGTVAWTHHAESPVTSKPSQSYNGSKRLLVVITACGAISLSGTSNTAAVVALGCCNALLVSFSIALLEHAHRERTRLENGNGNVVSVNAFLSQPSSKGSTTETLLAVARDVSFAATVASWLAALILEDLTFRTFRYAPSIVPVIEDSSKLGQQLQVLAASLGMVLVHVGANTTLITTVSLPISVSQFSPCIPSLRLSRRYASPTLQTRIAVVQPVQGVESFHMLIDPIQPNHAIIRKHISLL